VHVGIEELELREVRMEVGEMKMEVGEEEKIGAGKSLARWSPRWAVLVHDYEGGLGWMSEMR